MRAALVALLLAGCGAVYGERPSETRERLPAGEPAAGRAAEGGRAAEDGRAAESAAGPSDEATTVVGTIGPDGRLQADTLAGLAPDTSRVERETVVTGIVRRTGEPVPVDPAPVDLTPVDPAPEDGARIAGWRVQVFAARDRPAAAEVAGPLQERLPGETVHIEWQDGWYKVRVGDFPSREEAERLRGVLVGLGFTEAWAVQTAVRAEP
ncbi:MAG TPA: SPOR domain-containing protein [Gemmatimonadota bacterium]|nr:SPOR domain-containing protein [Gemmatimonadota bacterium]